MGNGLPEVITSKKWIGKSLGTNGTPNNDCVLMSPKDRRCGTEVNTTSNIKKVYLPYKRNLYITYGLIFHYY